MDLDPDEVVTVALDWDDLEDRYTCRISRRQLGELLLVLDDMADHAEEAEES
ncbi:hypothetical protein [Streptomyces sp. NPDC089799]|uniref:hypothetical protein n=1 Tax=Streptomyces sp. NPDC089799 TaxID=3155066 RepID=UPI00341BEE36